MRQLPAHAFRMAGKGGTLAPRNANIMADHAPDGLNLTVASYNIHKAIGRDRKRDAERILTVLGELDADVIALQEADLRFGSRAAVLPKEALHEQHWQIVPVSDRPASMGWHGNALLVRRGIDIVDAEPLRLPALEPRGALKVRLAKDGAEFCVASMHLDLSGLIRRKQLQAVCTALQAEDAASIMLGDFNEWSANLGALRVLKDNWTVLAPGRSFPSGNPIAQLDRIVHSTHWHAHHCHVHRSPLASLASDHLPVRAEVVLLPKK